MKIILVFCIVCINLFGWGLSDLASTIEKTTGVTVKIEDVSKIDKSSSNKQTTMQKREEDVDEGTITEEKTSKINKNSSNKTKKAQDKKSNDLIDQYVNKLNAIYVTYVKRKGLENLSNEEILFSCKLTRDCDIEKINSFSAIKQRRIIHQQKEVINQLINNKKYNIHVVENIDGNIRYNFANLDIDNFNVTVMLKMGDFLPLSFGQTYPSSFYFFSTKKRTIKNKILKKEVESYRNILQVEVKKSTPWMIKKLPKKYVNIILNLDDEEIMKNPYKDFSIVSKLVYDDRKIEFIEANNDVESYLKIFGEIKKLNILYKNKIVLSFNNKELKKIPKEAKLIFFNAKYNNEIYKNGFQYDNYEPILLLNTNKNNPFSPNLVNAKKVKTEKFCKSIKSRNATIDEIKLLYILHVFDDIESESIPIITNSKVKYYNLKNLLVVSNPKNSSNQICVKKRK